MFLLDEFSFISFPLSLLLITLTNLSPLLWTADALQALFEQEARSELDSTLRPRSHAFLALLRALAREGRADEARRLADRMVWSCSGHVTIPDGTEADQLVLEAALNSGQVQSWRSI